MDCLQEMTSDLLCGGRNSQCRGIARSRFTPRVLGQDIGSSVPSSIQDHLKKSMGKTARQGTCARSAHVPAGRSFRTWASFSADEARKIDPGAVYEGVRRHYGDFNDRIRRQYLAEEQGYRRGSVAVQDPAREQKRYSRRWPLCPSDTA